MTQEQLLQAQGLFFQTGLTKTEIAAAVGISRRTLHYWIRHFHWDAIKTSVEVTPAALAGNCYLLLARLQQHILSPDRDGNPITLQEVNAIHRLVVTIGKLNTEPTLGQHVEMMSAFSGFVAKQHPEMEPVVQDMVSDFITKQAAGRAASGHISASLDTDEHEQQLDQEDRQAWAAEQGAVTPTDNPATTSTTSGKPGNNEPHPLNTSIEAPDPAPGQPVKLNRAARRRLARAAA